MKYTQYQLRKSVCSDLNAEQQVCWLEANRCKVGDRVILKDEDGEWLVVEQYATEDEANFKDAHESRKTFGSIQKMND